VRRDIRGLGSNKFKKQRKDDSKKRRERIGTNSKGFEDQVLTKVTGRRFLKRKSPTEEKAPSIRPAEKQQRMSRRKTK
jgi:hypothetical protein